MNWIIRMRGLGAFALMVVACFGNESIASGQLNLVDDGWHTWRTAAPEQSAEAIFWLVQSNSDAAFEYIDRLLTGT